MSAPGEITRLLKAHEAGDVAAFERLTAIVYADLKRLAASMLRGHRDAHTLGATGVVHEAWVKLEDDTRRAWVDRGHFMAVASRAIRQVIVDYARRRGSQKRGGHFQIVGLDLDTPTPAPEQQADWVLTVHDAIERLHAHDARLARVVECRFFAGYSDREIAEALGTSLRTVERDWPRARAWLQEMLEPDNHATGRPRDDE